MATAILVTVTFEWILFGIARHTTAASVVNLIWTMTATVTAPFWAKRIVKALAS